MRKLFIITFIGTMLFPIMTLMQTQSRAEAQGCGGMNWIADTSLGFDVGAISETSCGTWHITLGLHDGEYRGVFYESSHISGHVSTWAVTSGFTGADCNFNCSFNGPTFGPYEPNGNIDGLGFPSNNVSGVAGIVITSTYYSEYDVTFDSFVTPTPIPPTPGFFSPTLATTPIPSLSCTIPDSATAGFLPGNKWSLAGGADYAIPTPPRWLDLPPGGSATTSLNLAEAEYQYTITYQSSGLGGGSLIASIAGVPYTLSPTDSAEHTFVSDPVKYVPGSTTIILSKPSIDSVNVTVKYFCLNPVQGSAPAPILQAGSSGNNDQCASCDPPLNITDIPGIINWLLCNIRRLWTCYLLPILSPMLAFIASIIKFLISFFAWLVKAFNDFNIWSANLVSSIWGSISGWLSNVFVGLNNNVFSGGIADDSNIIASRSRDLPTMIGNGIASLGGQLSDVFLHPAGNLIGFVVQLISFAASAVAYILGLIPLVIQSLVEGIQSSSTTISGSPVCNNPDSLLYFPCLGFYLLDNTIFTGPAAYLIPVLIALVVFDNITWAFNRVKEELSK